MDFERVVKALVEEFERCRIRYGVIGGFALGALGIPRATMDIDFLVHRDDLEALDQLLTGLGYRRHVRLENVSHYRHTEHAAGSIDVIHAFRAFALGMLERATPHPIFNGTRTMRVLQPEDIIGLKVQAVANDPARQAQERADIEELMRRYGKQLDWKRIQEYYEVFELGDEAKALRQRFAHADGSGTT